MSALSGLFKTAGKKRGPGGKETGSLQEPSGWQVDLAVITDPASFLHDGHLEVKQIYFQFPLF